MTDPTNYTPSFSFSDFQSNSPSAPLPAPPLDNELADIAAAVATIVSAVKDIRRNDGALPNGIVTFDSLTLALQLMFASTNVTNANLVANAVAAAQASATSASGSASTATTQAAAALASAIAAAASASSVNLTLFLAKANNLAGLGSQSTSRSNLGLGSVATFDVGPLASNIVQLDGSAKIPAYDGSQLINIDVLPVGAVVLVPGSNAITGTVKLNGALLSRTSFPRLWAYAQGSGSIASEASWAAGNSGGFSTGDLATTFRVPDHRGEFLRGFDNGRGVDSGRVIGTNQADSLKDHTHTYQYYGTNLRNDGTQALTVQSALTTGTTSGASTGAAAETRPRNVPILACIKY